MTFICATKIKHVLTDQIKTAFRFSFNVTRSNETRSIKERYVTSFGVILKQRHEKKICRQNASSCEVDKHLWYVSCSGLNMIKVKGTLHFHGLLATWTM